MTKHQGTTTTRAQDVHALLREDILDGRIPPGTRLKFQELCEKYGTSVGAAREALTRLVSENLVALQPRQGYSVRTLSEADLTDLVQARVEIEALAFRMSVDTGDMAWEAATVAAHHVLERTPFADDGDDEVLPGRAWVEAHRLFHIALIAACPNRRLLDYAIALREEAILYQMWSISAQREPDRDAAGEHRALLDAAIKRDAELADHLLREHLLHTGRLLLDPNTVAGAAEDGAAS